MVVDLKESREKIDKIDRQIAELFEKKDDCCSRCCSI